MPRTLAFLAHSAIPVQFTEEDFAEFRRYCRSIDLSFASFAVLTPLPGTELYDQVEGQLLTHAPEFFDFIHTVLPTALPLEAFYSEYARLYAQALSPKQQWALLRKFRLRDLPAVLGGSVLPEDRVRAIL